MSSGWLAALVGVNGLEHEVHLFTSRLLKARDLFLRPERSHFLYGDDARFASSNNCCFLAKKLLSPGLDSYGFLGGRLFHSLFLNLGSGFLGYRLSLLSRFFS